MDKATVAIIVSPIPAGVPFLSLGWNIYSDEVPMLIQTKN